MYIQPYEPQELDSTTTSPFSGHAAPGDVDSPNSAPFGGDSIDLAFPFNGELPEIADGSSALEDGPLGSLGLGGMLMNLTGMMQQLTQMMQSLLGGMSNGNAGSGVSNAACFQGGCTQTTLDPYRHYLEGSDSTSTQPYTGT